MMWMKWLYPAIRRDDAKVFFLSPQKFIYYVVIRIGSDFQCKMHLLKMHG